MRTNLNAKPISEINSLFTRREVNLNPSYQRRPVWSFRSKTYLIDTILQGLPIPKFFIEIKVDTNSGNTIYDVVDGQQRLTAIFEFIKGKTSDGRDFKLSKKNHPKPESFLTELEGLDFLSLPKKLKDRFWLYKLSFEELIDAERYEIEDMFIRLNLSGAKLNSQELRNAAYHGAFKQLVYDTSNKYDEYFVNSKVLSASSVKRMIDAEFVSELYASMIRGLQDKKKVLDKIYEELDTMDNKDADKLRKSFDSTMNLIDKIMGKDIITTRFNNKADFYSLFYVLFDITKNKRLKILKTFHLKIRKILIELNKNVKLESDNKALTKYYEGTVNAGDAIRNRKYRHEILTNLIEPFCIKRDERRLFSEFEKKFFWHNNEEKICGICSRKISSYKDYQIDHIKSWDKGGHTNLSNAQLAHANCNRAKGNR